MNEWRCKDCGSYFESCKVDDEEEICFECGSDNTEFIQSNDIDDNART
jgi:rRNA maturation endonuclease Nob1